jgi:hypothetical protein
MTDPSERRVQTTVAVYIAGFSIGVVSHARDFLTHGWQPYHWGVPILDGFWTSLIVLDAAVVALLWAGYRRAGLCGALAIMTCDVVANTYALLGLKIQQFAAYLTLQAIFFGFVLGSIALIWPRRERDFDPGAARLKQ